MALTYGIFYNKNSGHGHAEKKAKICQKKLLAADHQVEMINDDSLAKSQNHLAKKLSDLDFLVIVGGDGTLNGALSVIVKYDHPLPVGVIPAGTVNNFAKRYHLALETNAAIQTILDVPQIRYVGLGKCGKDQAIVSSLTFGNLANISNKVRQQDKQKFGLGVYLTKAFRQIGHDKSYLIEYQLGKNRVKTLRTWFAHPLPVGVIPAGTVNNFAKRYHLALETNAAIQTILDVPQIRYVGLGKCGKDQAIVSSLTFGNLANISNKVRQQDKQKFGLGVYLTKAFRQIGHDKSYLIEYQLGKNRVKTLRTWFALITTTRSVGGFPYDAGASGKMHVSLLNDIHVHQVWEYIHFAMTGRLRASKNITAFTTQKLTLTPKDNKIVSSRIDGDQGPQLPLTVSFLPEYLPLIVPS